jgi:hypothetical protein
VPEESPFPLLDVSDWTWTLNEPMGKPGKRWLTDPDGRSWLWKPTTMQREAATTFLKGDDWSEKLAAELARRLGIPAAEAELARRDDQPGVILANVVPAGSELIHGNELLPAVVDGYGRELRQEVPGYRLDAIVAALEHFAVMAPQGAGESIDAVGTFVEYLALDALIGNTDRHHTNWGVTRRVEDGAMTLSPSFDHATSLGFQLSEAGRARYLDEPGGVARYASRARSRPFEGQPAPIDLLAHGLRLRPTVADHLGPAVENLDEAGTAALIDRVPSTLMSHPSRTFVQEMLTTNRRRILDACR